MEIYFSALPFKRTCYEGHGKVTASSLSTSGTFGPPLTSILGSYSPKASLSQWLDGGAGLSWPDVGSPWRVAFTLDSASGWLKLSLNYSQVQTSSCPILPHPVSSIVRPASKLNAFHSFSCFLILHRHLPGKSLMWLIPSRHMFPRECKVTKKN